MCLSDSGAMTISFWAHALARPLSIANSRPIISVVVCGEIRIQSRQSLEDAPPFFSPFLSQCVFPSTSLAIAATPSIAIISKIESLELPVGGRFP